MKCPYCNGSGKFQGRTLGERLLALRRSQGKTMTDVAGDLSMSRSFLSELENDKKDPSLSKARGLANYYGVTMDCLIELEKP